MSATTELSGPAISKPSAFRASIFFVSAGRASSFDLDGESTPCQKLRLLSATLTLKWPSAHRRLSSVYFRHSPSTRLRRRVLPLFGSPCVRERESQLSTRLHSGSFGSQDHR